MSASQSLTYDDVRGFLFDGLTSMGYSTTLPNVDPSAQRLPRIDPGPWSDLVSRLSPGAVAMVTVGGGAGPTLEGLYDQKFITVRVAGPPGNYPAGETLAYDIDTLLLRITSPTMIGGCRVLYVARTGGSPDLIDCDENSRYHFQTTYITPAMTGF